MIARVLVVIDMQNDIVSGVLGTTEAQAVLPRVIEKIKTYPGTVLYTRDTHRADYAQTQEGRFLPVPHCLAGNEGWALCPEIEALRREMNGGVFDKPTFGSLELADHLAHVNSIAPIEQLELVGVCTDICVISNALLLKAVLPEVPIVVDASCCAGVTPAAHQTALSAMAACQIIITGQE